MTNKTIDELGMSAGLTYHTEKNIEGQLSMDSVVGLIEIFSTE